MLQQGAAVVEAIGGAQAVGAAGSPLTAELLDSAAAQLRREYDSGNGGFGGAPKFPPHMNLLFLLRHHQRTGAAQDLEIVRHTCEAMARGGIYDQLAGGFARYSVDAHWTVPHFEKMLYDNALLLRVYTQLWRLTGDPLAARVAAETAAFLIDDLGTPEGGFASALDADTEGVEGLTYAWTPAQLIEVLGESDGTYAADLFGVTQAGTFEHGTSVLRLARDVDDADAEVTARWARVRARLREVRDTRPQPARDDKVVAAWNGLAITALVEHEPPHRRPGHRRGGHPGRRTARRAAPGRRAAAPGLPRRRGRGTRPASWRTTAASPRRSAPCTSSPGRDAGWSWPAACSTPRWSTSPPRGAASTTPPTTPSGSSPARPTRPTTPPRRASPRSSRPW